MSDALDEMIASFRQMSQLPERVAERVAPALEAKLKATASAGTSPDGKPWAPKKDGGRAMPNAAQAISVRAIGPTVRVTLSGPEVFHHYGRGSTEVRRPIIPDSGAGMPPVVADILEEESAKAFEELTGGKR